MPTRAPPARHGGCQEASRAGERGGGRGGFAFSTVQHPRSRLRSMSSRTFRTTPSVLVQVGVLECRAAPAPSAIVSPTPGSCRAPRHAAAPPRRRTRSASLVRHPRQAHTDYLRLALRCRVVDPVVEAAALERVVQLAGAVRGHDDERATLRRDRPQLRDRDLEVGQELEQERLELVVGPVESRRSSSTTGSVASRASSSRHRSRKRSE